MASVFTLPRYIALKADDGHDSYLTVAIHREANDVPYLTFTAKQKTRLAVHEVVYNTDVSGVVMIRAVNRRFWRRNAEGWIVADREEIPDPSIDKACYFRATGLTSNVMVLQSIVDDAYVKRFTERIENGLSAVTNSVDIHTRMQVIAADDTAVTLPRYIMLYGDNNMYMSDHHERNERWLKFSKPTVSLLVTHEVIPLLNGNLVIRNLNVDKFWRCSPNWVRPDADLSNALLNEFCHIDVIKLSSTLVAFKSLSNGLFLKRYSEYWQHCLSAVGNSTNDTTTHLVLSEALLSRSLFDIRYLLNLAEVSELKPVMVGSGSMWNNTSHTTVLEVLVNLTQRVSTTEAWSTSTTFSTSLSVGFTIGAPEVASVNGNVTIGHAKTISTEMGKTTEFEVQFQTTFRVENVPPGVEVKVTVECTTAKLRVPFTYKSKDKRIDGVDLPTVDNVDGIFEGVQAFNIRGVVSEVNRSTATNILPVDVKYVLRE